MGAAASVLAEGAQGAAGGEEGAARQLAQFERVLARVDALRGGGGKGGNGAEVSTEELLQAVQEEIQNIAREEDVEGEATPRPGPAQQDLVARAAGEGADAPADASRISILVVDDSPVSLKMAVKKLSARYAVTPCSSAQEAMYLLDPTLRETEVAERKRAAGESNSDDGSPGVSADADEETQQIAAMKKEAAQLAARAKLLSDQAEAWENPRFDLVLTDIVMPDMDGVQFLTKLKHEMPRNIAAIPTAMLSGVEDQALAQVCLDQGAVAVLIKPLKLETVAEVVAEHCRKKTKDQTGTGSGLYEVLQKQNGHLAAADSIPETIRTPGKTSILVVDDSRISAELATRKLVKRGYDSMYAENGQVALELLQRYPNDFDLILLDIVMPVMNGVELLEIVIADEKLRGIPVVMVSALEDEALAAVCLTTGAAAVLPKPLEVDQVHDLIESGTLANRPQGRTDGAESEGTDS